MAGEDFGRNGASEQVGLGHIPCQIGQTGAVARLGSELPRVLNL
jgi:hypothetical protein